MVAWLASLLGILLALIGGFVPSPPPPSPASVTVQPETVALHPGETEQLSVAVVDGGGRPVNPSKVVWSTSAASVATVSAAGLVRAVAPGTATITATSGDVADTSVVTVTPVPPPNQPPTVTITAPTDGATFLVGRTISFEATATDPEDGSLTSSIAWSIDGTSLGTGGTVTTSTLAPGTHTATASVTDAGGITATDTVTVTVPPNGAPTVAITAPAVDGQWFLTTDVITFTAEGQDVEDQLGDEAIEWSLDGTSLGTGGTVTTSTLAPGTHTVTATITDSQGLTATDSVTVRVATPVPPSLTVVSPTASGTYLSTEVIELGGSAADVDEGDLTAAIVWSIDGTEVGTGGAVAAGPLTPGTHDVTASVTDSNGLIATTTVTITVAVPDAAPTVAITGPSDGAQLYGSETFDVTATATDPEDGDLSAAVEWSIESSNGTAPAGTGSPLTLGPLPLDTYTITATVTDAGGLTATDQITVHVVQEPVTVSVAATTDGPYGDNATIGFTATVTGAVTGTIDDALDDLATWTLYREDDGPSQDVGTGATVEVGPLAPGTYTITATVDPGGSQSPASAQTTFTVLDCTVTAIFRPATGLYIPQTLALSATTSTDSCNRPLRYYWGCESDTIPYCAAFEATANADGNTHPHVEIQINTFDEIAILLDVCAVDPTSTDPRGDCAPQIVRVYRGAVTSTV